MPNVVETLHFVETIIGRGCTRLIFSSSASIYVPDSDFTVDENSPVQAFSPYARTKIVCEQMLQDICAATALKVMSLRYFNPVGADPKMRTGLQLPHPSHALGKLIQLTSAADEFEITGDDYPTRDGSGIRDYVHVWDLALAHVAAIERFDRSLADRSSTVINLGTGQGTTVKELVAEYENVIGKPVRARIAPRRPGDVAGAFTRSKKANEVLDWRAERSLAVGIADTLRWFDHRPQILGDIS